jgi:hypothetical protein
MRNFDDHRAKRLNKAQRTFQIGGEQFVAKASVRPEALAEWDDLDPENASTAEIMRVSDNTILALIEPGEDGEAHDRFRQIRLREGDDALNLSDCTMLLKWLIEVQSGGRPTEPQSGSTQSPSGTGASSTDASHSPGSPAEPQPSTLGSS